MPADVERTLGDERLDAIEIVHHQPQARVAILPSARKQESGADAIWAHGLPALAEPAERGLAGA
jgi:hypothetical protein